MDDDLYAAILCRTPTSELAERALAGALLYGAPSATVTAARATKPSDYTDPHARAVIQTCLTLIDQGHIPDPIGVKAVLETTNTTPPVGTWALYLLDCLHACTIPAAAPHWAELICATADRRGRVQTAVRILQADLAQEAA
jgi:replicative DNA helicase